MTAVETKSKFTEMLDAGLKETGLSQAELGRRIGKDRSYIYAVLNGKMTPEADKTIALARSLGLSVVELLEAAGHANVAAELRGAMEDSVAEFRRLCGKLNYTYVSDIDFAALPKTEQDVLLHQLRGLEVAGDMAKKRRA